MPHEQIAYALPITGESVMPIHKVRALEYLVSVVECGGFNAAARRLGVAAPSVHRLVQALEAELGVLLIDRSVQPVVATADAVHYVARARLLLTDLRELDAGLRDRTTAPRGKVDLAVHSVALQFVVPDLLPRFHARHPDIRLEIIEAGSERELSRLGTDALLQFGWPPAQDAVLRTLIETRWLVLATPSYWDRHGRPQHPSELGRHACGLFLTPFGEVIRQWVFTRGEERVQVEVDGWLTSDNRHALDAALHAGQLVMRVNDLTAPPGLGDGKLEPVLLDWCGMSSPPLSLLVKRSLVRQPRIRALIDFLVEHAQRLSENRLPAGLGPWAPAEKPEWWSRRTVVARSNSRADKALRGKGAPARDG
jgi:LysR family transcriptional regulator, regulator for bpeEF and oprC